MTFYSNRLIVEFNSPYLQIYLGTKRLVNMKQRDVKFEIISTKTMPSMPSSLISFSDITLPLMVNAQDSQGIMILNNLPFHRIRLNPATQGLIGVKIK
jgi:hypothetical protein